MKTKTKNAAAPHNMLVANLLQRETKKAPAWYFPLSSLLSRGRASFLSISVSNSLLSFSIEDGELFFFWLLNEESLFLFLYQYFNSLLLFGVWTHVLGIFYLYIFLWTTHLLIRWFCFFVFIYFYFYLFICFKAYARMNKGATIPMNRGATNN